MTDDRVCIAGELQDCVSAISDIVGRIRSDDPKWNLIRMIFTQSCKATELFMADNPPAILADRDAVFAVAVASLVEAAGVLNEALPD